MNSFAGKLRKDYNCLSPSQGNNKNLFYLMQMITIYLVVVKVLLNAKLSMKKVKYTNRNYSWAHERVWRQITFNNSEIAEWHGWWCRMGLSSEPYIRMKEIYKKARIACLENIEKISRIQQNNPDNNNNVGMNLILRSMWTQVQWLCLVRWW